MCGLCRESKINVRYHVLLMNKNCDLIVSDYVSLIKHPSGTLLWLLSRRLSAECEPSDVLYDLNFNKNDSNIADSNPNANNNNNK